VIVVVIGKLDVTLAGRRRFPFFEVVEWWRELTGPPRKGFGFFWEPAHHCRRDARSAPVRPTRRFTDRFPIGRSVRT
jgi:hypothetical protein